jgi:macrodomain Ter protein organizer (MatP/YcbG family)
MHNINYLLAKAIQKDHLRSAAQNRLARLIEARRKVLTNAYKKKARLT